MAFNYFVAYDLNAPDQNYPAVKARIEGLGPFAKLQYSLYYLKSDLTQAAVHDSIRQVMDGDDKLAVIWAQDARISHYPPDVLQRLRDAFTTP